MTDDQIRYNQYLEQAIFCLYGTDSGVQSTIGTKRESITNNGQSDHNMLCYSNTKLKNLYSKQ